MHLSKIKLLATTLFCLIALVCVPITGQAYYGSSLYGGLYGSSMYGGLYGGGLYGGLYGGGMYGGLYGGGMYGGLYGGGMYGGLYGGGMYGGLYGGGMYGGLYGGGMYGGLYGGLYGSSLYGGLYGGGMLGGLLGRFPYSAASAPLVEPVRAPAALTSLLLSTSGGGGGLNPTGTWSGTWLSYISLKGGICNMNLLYSSLTGTVSGTAGLLLNKLIPIPINVAGLYLGSPFTMTGSYLDPISLVTYYEELTCTLVSASFMTGTYSIHDLLYTKTDLGEFNISLVPVI